MKMISEEYKFNAEMNWIFIALIHNLSLMKPIEGDLLAMVPETDTRAVCLLKKSSALRHLVSNFTDQFHRRISPTLLLAKQETPSSVLQQDAIVGFRNIIAISAITFAWQDTLVKKLSLNVLKYSNYFDIYPITISKDGETLIVRSPLC